MLVVIALAIGFILRPKEDNVSLSKLTVAEEKHHTCDGGCSFLCRNGIETCSANEQTSEYEGEGG